MPNFVESLLIVEEDRGTDCLSFYAFFYFVDSSVALLDFRVSGSEAKLVRSDDVIKRCYFF
jgi:hypothetical protein